MSGGAVLAGCSSGATASSAPATHTSIADSTHVCAGTRSDAALVAACPAPAGIRPGRTCEGALSCPSANELFGACRCDAGTWRCDSETAPKGYDPYPDCPDEGVEAEGACYLESSTCVPAAATTCFTSGVPLCRCEGHAWKC